MSANSFVNGFMGGMNAMNGMLDSKARREEAAWRKEMYLEDREIAAQDRAYQLEERGRIENVRNLSAVLHQYQGLDAAGKKSAGKAFVSAFNDIPGMSQYTDNSNPDERREVDDFRFTKNANGETWVVPVAGIYDVKTNKKIRAGDYTQNGENGGAPIGVPMKDFYDFLSSQQGSGAIRSMQAEVIRQGGTPTEAKEQWSDIQEKDGQFYQTNLTTNENKTVGYRRNGKGKGKNSGTGSDGSGYGGSDWTSVKNGTVEVPSATDPSVMVTVNRRLMHQEGTNNYVYEDDDGKGNIKYTEVKGKLPSGLESMFGVEAATTDPNAAPVVTAPNAPPVVAGAEAATVDPNAPAVATPKGKEATIPGKAMIEKDAQYGELGAITNKNGSVSTEYSVTENIPELGGWVNIPMMVKGQTDLSFLETGKISEDNFKIAVRRAIERKKAGANLPTYKSLEEAEAASKSRSEKEKMKPYESQSNAAAVIAANPGMIPTPEIQQEDASGQYLRQKVGMLGNATWKEAKKFLKKRGQAAGTEYRGGMNDA